MLVRRGQSRFSGPFEWHSYALNGEGYFAIPEVNLTWDPFPSLLVTNFSSLFNGHS